MKTKSTWSPGMHKIWWSAFSILSITVIMLLVDAILTFREERKFEWFDLVATIAPIGVINWLISVKRHPEEWLDAQGKSRFRW